MNNIIRKVCCSISMLVVLFTFIGTSYAERSPFDFELPVRTDWVAAQKTGVKLLVLINKKQSGPETIYEWLGESRNGYANGVGRVNEYKNGAVITTYTGKFIQGKMQGTFSGDDYGKVTSHVEWTCNDGNLNGPLRIVDEKQKIEFMIQNDKVTSISMVTENSDIKNLYIKLDNGQPVSAKMQFTTGSYEGGIDKNGMTGTGILTITNSFVYEGGFANNKLNGQGTITYSDGRVLVANFVAGALNGYGTMYNKNKEIVKQGIWENNKFIDSAPQ